jgi:hypothetical protein
MNARTLIFFGAVFAVAAGCGGESETESFSEVRTVEPPAPSSADSSAPDPHAGIPGMGAPVVTAGLQWTTPDGWTEEPASAMRIINLGVEGEPDVECYVTRLGGTGGGLDANLNRWRSQMSLPAYTDEEIAALPTATILGEEAVIVEMQGDYTGMGATEAQENFALVGAVVESGDASYFIKMTGPADVIEREREKFNAFCASIETGAPATAADPHAGIDMGAAQQSGALSWTAPDGWEQAPDRPMREVTFTVNGAECYIAILQGTGGGVALNVNRWVGQMGQPELSESEIESLETINVLGEPSPLVEAKGAYTDMGGNRTMNAMLLGVVREDPDESVFIKMTGPESVVEAERENFIAFCESLE